MAEVSRQNLYDRLQYASPLHTRIVQRIRERRKLAEREISRRYEDWRRVDEHLQMYIDLSRQARKGDKTSDPNAKEMPFERSVVVPMSYAILQVRLTAIMAIFLARQPVIQLTGRGPEDVKPARLMEATLGYDLQETAAILAFYATFQSAEKYGLGVMADGWERENGWITKRFQVPGASQEMMQFLSQMSGVPLARREWGMVREYNQIRAVDPYYYWPDPRVPGHDIQAMEFVGDRVFRSFTHLDNRSVRDGGVYFNLEEARKRARGGATREGGGRLLTPNRTEFTRFSMNESPDEYDRGIFAVDQMEINVIPREWGLSGERRPEKWRFALLEDQVLIRAHRSPYEHGQFCYSAMQPNYDAFSNFTNGVIEDLDGLQRIMNFLFNSHKENVQRFLNDAFIYDPALIEEDDLLNPGPARHIRMTQAASELIQRGLMTPNNLITQLPMIDVTQGHMSFLDSIFEMAQRMTGVNDPAMGQPLPGRRTLGEVERVIFSSSRRMALSAQLYDIQAIWPMTRRMIANRQQFMSEEQFFNIIGEETDMRAVEQALINRQQILGNFNYIPVSGIVPPDPARFAETWIQLLQVMGQLPPEILMQYNIGEFVSEIAKGLGVKNLERFKVQVQPDQQIASGVASGNLTPLGAGGNGFSGASPVGANGNGTAAT